MAIDAMLGGAVSYLESCPGVSKIKIGTTRAPSSLHAITQWEAAAAKAVMQDTGIARSITMPQDLKALYDVSDGFSFQWSAKFPRITDGRQKTNNTEACILGDIHVNGIDGLIHIPCQYSPNRKHKTQQYDNLLRGWKLPPGPVFVLHNVIHHGKVCLVYPVSESGEQLVRDVCSAEVWFQTAKSGEWYFLSETFSGYFRLAVLHLGICGWQLLLTDQGVPQYILDWISFYSPAAAAVMRTVRVEGAADKEQGNKAANDLWRKKQLEEANGANDAFDCDTIMQLLHIAKS
ncbi:Tubulin polyglutamylase complex subunit 2 [Physocladia obscura]|uniref:Tubulin polyglutamylase complex subunit 2 n=1 Tax=Physocladia obscura TaxID=109957 RepID=A0AAD5SZD5_9FUNG|nr:Tubulin polyglutamylase complex subunit 2 [Physocladia obscura]